MTHKVVALSPYDKPGSLRVPAHWSLNFECVGKQDKKPREGPVELNGKDQNHWHPWAFHNNFPPYKGGDLCPHCKEPLPPRTVTGMYVCTNIYEGEQ